MQFSCRQFLYFFLPRLTLSKKNSLIPFSYQRPCSFVIMSLAWGAEMRRCAIETGGLLSEYLTRMRHHIMSVSGPLRRTWQQTEADSQSNVHSSPGRMWHVPSIWLQTDLHCKVWGFHCGDYEECRLLGYKNPVGTSQETHYVSATDSSRIILCKIWGFHGGDYEEWRLLGFYAVWLLLEPTFRWNQAPPASVASYGWSSYFTDSCHPDDGGAEFLRNVGSYKSLTA
jgi:hypothetical protein